ncbi:hypothetical protein MPER_12948 [Moniliophthora perniciosa FA553]|nr:hypothetical protein MPER_12948 [Moniliophthora perniciosa FA553]
MQSLIFSGLVVNDGELSQTQQTKREEQLAKIHEWLEDSINGDGPSAIAHPPVGLRAFVYATPANLEEAVTASRETALTSMVSGQNFLICRYHTKSQKTRNKAFELVDGYDGINYGRLWQPLSRSERISLLAQEKLNPTTKQIVDENDPLHRYRWPVPGWIRVKGRDPRAMDCGCFMDYVLLEAYLWKTGKLGSLTSKLVDDWGREFLTPRHRALVCESFRHWTGLELDDMYSLVAVNGKWVRRDDMHARRVQLLKLQGMVGLPAPMFQVVKDADEEKEMEMIDD